MFLSCSPGKISEAWNEIIPAVLSWEIEVLNESINFWKIILGLSAALPTFFYLFACAIVCSAWIIPEKFYPKIRGIIFVLATDPRKPVWEQVGNVIGLVGGLMTGTYLLISKVLSA